MTERTYALSPDCGEKFYNQADYCIGTGRMGLALHKEYYDQLKLVQEHIGFSHIRGHGLFCDDMAIYQEYKNAQGETVTEYNFTYLDRVLDSYQELGLRPFLELGFMPEKMASGDQTVFYWKGNTTPPKDYAQWRALVQALLRHLLERYGQDALAWPLEVWNEPNLPGFWKGADKEEYFRLFSETIAAVKEVDNRFTVGGPAICGVKDVEWMQDFMEYCHQNSLPLDFVTRHFYTFDDPEFVGRYSYGGLRDPEISLEELRRSREIIDSYPEYKGLPMHITEFNTSYSPDSPVHDTTRNAAYIARLLACLGEMNESYSYWTFGDVFEEKGVPFTPFHGGFGLVANGCIPKPTFWTFAFFKELQGQCLLRNREAVAVQRPDGTVAGVAWNMSQETKGETSLTFTLPAQGEWCLLTKTVDEGHANPLKVWHDLGEPRQLTAAQTALLQESAQPLVSTQRLTAEDGQLSFTLRLKEDAVVSFQLLPAAFQGDRGYDYRRAVVG